MQWAEQVLGYCERSGPGVGQEPFNTLTALAFLLVAWRALKAAPEVEDRQAALALALVGVASALHHGLAIRLTLWVDILANLLYLALLGRLMLRRLAGAGQAVSLLGGAAGVALAYALLSGPNPLVGPGPSLWPLRDLFVLELLLLLGLALGLRGVHAGTARAVMLAAVVLAMGLPFRFLDLALCPLWPLGTHGLWHLANAGATAHLLAGLARHQARS